MHFKPSLVRETEEQSPRALPPTCGPLIVVPDFELAASALPCAQGDEGVTNL